ncbi:transposase [Pseudonocardia hierapolitana]|uniref:transposase n=1 Tax=Pseudonocardia hierapolitana TaxID=1128676 RepID=UPI003CCC50D7
MCPRSWAEDPVRRAAAGVPDEVEFATKPALATTMIARGVEAGLPVGWVTADEVYDIDPELRANSKPCDSAICWVSAATAGSAFTAPAVVSGWEPTRSPPVWPTGAGPGSPSPVETRDPPLSAVQYNATHVPPGQFDVMPCSTFAPPQTVNDIVSRNMQAADTFGVT